MSRHDCQGNVKKFSYQNVTERWINSHWKFSHPKYDYLPCRFSVQSLYFHENHVLAVGRRFNLWRHRRVIKTQCPRWPLFRNLDVISTLYGVVIICLKGNVKTNKYLTMYVTATKNSSKTVLKRTEWWGDGKAVISRLHSDDLNFCTNVRFPARLREIYNCC